MEKIIEVLGLTKSYRDVQAVRGIDFYVETGALFAFLGPNGAGKSTTIDVICTLLQPDKGTVTVDGHQLSQDDAKIRQSIGVVFQDSILDDLLTVEENLNVRAAFYGHGGEARRQAVKRAAKAAEVEGFLNRPYGKLSGGQRRRADIARALVNTPKILFLDEPTTGLDPQTRQSVWNTIRQLQKQEGVTVFLTTHYMEEAAGADYVAVIDKGLITAKGTPAELKDRFSSDQLKIKPSDRSAVLQYLGEKNVAYEAAGGMVTIPLARTMDALPILKGCEEWISTFEVVSGSMDDAFIAITGKGIREE
jgi:multidrug/hemolysin transport system ATP-binding protein